MLPGSELRTFGPCLYIQNSAAPNQAFTIHLNLAARGRFPRAPSLLVVSCLLGAAGFPTAFGPCNFTVWPWQMEDRLAPIGPSQ